MSLTSIAPARGYAVVSLVLALGAAAPARADGLELPPPGALPAAPSVPHLWVDGADPAALAALVARKTHPRTAGLYTSFKGYVDARLGSIGTADDDTRSKVAKAAALLHLLGDTPASGPHATYRAAAVAALAGVGSRQAADTVLEIVSPGPGVINVLQDASRLQSMCEAYDLLRGSGVAAGDDTILRAHIAEWAGSLLGDWNLIGALGVPPHRDNWAIKAGGALVTCALALPDHGSAASWLAFATTIIDESLAAVVSATGWFRESVWYLNYALANLWPAAWHVRNTLGVDWPAALRPLVEASLAWRQPDGRAPPFEEGLPNTFPWNVVASAYPDLAPALLWAWDESDHNVENFDNQLMHDVTRFILAELDATAEAPASPSTRFLAGDTSIFTLASGWGDDALQVTGITAVDHATTETSTSRHNTRNPLDLVLHGGGALLVPTASGGPTVTTTGPTRPTYLAPAARNIPLVAGTAPFITAATDVRFGDRLDSRDEGAADNHLADLVRTTIVDGYAAGAEVSRAVALVDEGWVVVADRLALPAAAQARLSWRGRGARATRSATGALRAFTWTSATRPALDLDVVASAPLSHEDNPSLYADAWAASEAIDGVLVGASTDALALLSIFQVGEATPRAVLSIGDASAAAARVLDPGGTIEHVIVQPLAPGAPATAGGLTTDGALAIVRLVDGELAALCLQAGTTLARDGAPLVAASGPVTLCATLQDGGFVAEISHDSPGRDVLVSLPTHDPLRAWSATLEGEPLDASELASDAQGVTFTGLGAGTLVVTSEEAQDPCADASTRCDDADPCTSDACVTETGVCTHLPWTGPLEGDDPDGLFCTVDERCEAGAPASSPRDCGEPAALCAIDSVCDEATRACRDVLPTCDEAEHTVHATVLDAEGEPVGSIRCTLAGGSVSCDVHPDGTLVVHDAVYCE